MIKTRGLNATGRYSLPAGGYVCRVRSASVGTSHAGNPCLILCVDVAEGDFAGFFQKSFERLKTLFGNVTWPYDATSRVIAVDERGFLHWRLEHFLSLVKESNPQFDYDPCKFDESTLVGRLVGFEFVTKTNGKVGTRIGEPRSLADIRAEKCTVPTPLATSTPQETSTPPANDLSGKPLGTDDIAPPEFDLGQFDE